MTIAKERLASLGEYLFLVCISVGIVLIFVVMYVQDSTRNTSKSKPFRKEHVLTYWESKFGREMSDLNDNSRKEKEKSTRTGDHDFKIQIGLDENPLRKYDKLSHGIFPLTIDVPFWHSWCPNISSPYYFETTDDVLSDDEHAEMRIIGKELEGAFIGKEWHYGQPGILDLVDPLMYCLVSGVTIYNVTEDSKFQIPFTHAKPEYSKKFQMLPTEFYFDPILKKVKTLSYINNLDPRKYENLYRLIEIIIAEAVPYFEMVLKNLIRCKVTRCEVNLGWRPLQIIVGMTTMHLTPDSPNYNGSDWHVEGLINESIVASAIYFYDVTNKPHESFVSFLCKVGRTRPQDRVLIKRNRIVVFPNIEHKIELSQLDDRNKIRHRKFLTVSLVDPDTQIVSTANVAPQQQSWYPITESDAANRFQGITYRKPRSMSLGMAKFYRNNAIEDRKIIMKKYKYTDN